MWVRADILSLLQLITMVVLALLHALWSLDCLSIHLKNGGRQGHERAELPTHHCDINKCACFEKSKNISKQPTPTCSQLKRTYSAAFGTSLCNAKFEDKSGM
ncbi:hypothetical protein DL98DRAFT_531500 [Cadophora sp. DSE1049]|nr:hypothetical protein DL98DRAFT_531500 [Cadophora sp. DSE1049]